MYIKCIVVYSAIEGFTLQMSIEKYACFVWLRKSKKKKQMYNNGETLKWSSGRIWYDCKIG
jgi:hypothetical protein